MAWVFVFRPRVFLAGDYRAQQGARDRRCNPIYRTKNGGTKNGGSPLRFNQVCLCFKPHVGSGGQEGCNLGRPMSGY